MSQRDFNDIIRSQLSESQRKVDLQNKEREQEIAPVEGPFVQITTGKIHDLLNYSIKTATNKAKEILKQKTGIDLDELQQRAQDQINKVSAGIDEAKAQVNKTLSQSTNFIQPSLDEAYELVEPVEQAEPEQTEPVEIEDDL